MIPEQAPVRASFPRYQSMSLKLSLFRFLGEIPAERFRRRARMGKPH
jgi:hypothetical protein